MGKEVLNHSFFVNYVREIVVNHIVDSIIHEMKKVVEKVKSFYDNIVKIYDIWCEHRCPFFYVELIYTSFLMLSKLLILTNKYILCYEPKSGINKKWKFIDMTIKSKKYKSWKGTDKKEFD
jgi:hypothetical protein